MRSLLLTALALVVSGCPAPTATDGPAPASPLAAVNPAGPPKEHGPALDFVLDSVDKSYEHQAESEALRGKRAIVLMLATYDVGSLLALRTLAPLLNELPKDATCLQIAMQPLGDRELVAAFFDAEKTPCRRAIGDAKRGRLGDLAAVKIIPAVIVLRADGSVAGTVTGSFSADDVRKVLETAK